jgi:hypothetical protein
LSEHQTGTTPTASSPETPKTSDADWVVDRIAQQRAVRAQAEEFHNRPLDNQAGIAELLAKITAAPLPVFEEHASEVYAELLDLLVSKQADYGPGAINRAPRRRAQRGARAHARQVGAAAQPASGRHRPAARVDPRHV